MFSYLHGIRPSHRRSAIPPAAPPPQSSSSRYYHETATLPPTPSFNLDLPAPRISQANSFNEASPISPDPPVLPPIPRVASQDEDHSSGGRRNPEEGSSFDDTRRHPSQEAPPGNSKGATNDDYGPSVARKDHPHRTSRETDGSQPLKASQQPRPAPSTWKRPIDHAYDTMRSYSEPPRPQFFSSNPDNTPFLPQAKIEPPLPPPKLPYVHPPPQRQAPIPPVIIQSQIPPTTAQKSHGKAKLNLLNPMTLLARRRSSQSEEEAYSQNQNTSRMPDDYDPRIRGKVVHDFSAPRPGRPLSSNGIYQDMSLARLKGSSPNRNSASKQEDDSPSSTEKDHTPVFKENFDDDVEPWSSEMDSPAKRRSSAFMYQVSLQASPPPTQSSLPAFARKLPCNVSNEIDALPKSSSPPPKAPLTVLLEAPLPKQKFVWSSPPTSPPTTRSRSASNTDPCIPTPASPQRFKSNASRFSFDLAGVGSAAQEKLLEEKHRQKVKRNEHGSTLSDDNELDEDDSYDNYDDMEDDGLEERIPGVNADDEDSDMPVSQHAMDTTNFISPNKSSFESVTSPVSTGLTSPGTPHDSYGQPMGLPVSDLSPHLSELRLGEDRKLSKMETLRPRSTPGPSMVPTFKVQPLQREVASETNLAGLPNRYDSQEDDMYFDDGMIEDLDDGEFEAFDESVFDEDSNEVYGLPLRDLKPMAKPQDRKESAIDHVKDPQLALEDSVSPDNQDPGPSPPGSSNDADTRAGMRDSVANLNQPARAQSISHTFGLTQDNLGLHDRLAFAANQAALEGKFNRTYSQGSTHESLDCPDPSPGTTTQENQMTGLFIPRAVDDIDGFAFDDTDIAFSAAEDDDPIIAAANAEALENDDDGFYGQEFGFFARRPGSSEAEYVNGGYFGSRAIEGIYRMNSGRDNFQEPSLTPITERSEWSNRNSMVSLAMHGYPLSAQYQSNPQLADLMRVQEGEEMSLEGLRRLRRGAWGGSNGSLQSGSNSHNGGSPVTYLPPGMVAPLMQATNSNGSLMSPSSQNLAGSFHSYSSGGHLSSNDSNPSPSAESPTITLSTSHSGLMIQQPMGPPPPPPIDPSSRRLSAMDPKPWVPSKTSSGAESVSYWEENGRWLCEKTRVIEGTGEIEVFGRSVVEGGRI